MRYYLVERTEEGRPFVTAEEAVPWQTRPDSSVAEPGSNLPVQLTREELLRLPGGARALERWYSADDSVFAAKMREQVRRDREEDARMLAARRPPLRAVE